MSDPTTPPPPAGSAEALEPAMCCAICAAPLDVFRSVTRPDRPRHTHPDRPEPWDHEPVPIPVGDLSFLDRRCDFCGGTYPVFVYTTGGPIQLAADLGDEQILHDYGHTWQACAVCAELVEAGQHDRLWRHALAQVGWSPQDPQSLGVRVIHAAVLESLRPGRAIVTCIRWPATAWDPRTLPKIHARLTDLLRAPTGGPAPLGIPALTADPRVRQAVTSGLDEAGLYWIDPEFSQLTHHATASLPAATLTPEDVPLPHGFLVWAQPVGPHALDAASWTTTSSGWRVTTYRAFGTGLPDNLLRPLRRDLGWLLPVASTEFTTTDLLDATAMPAPLLVTWLLIAQRLAETTTLAPSPAERRAHARHYRGRPAPLVRLVHLRKRSPSPRPNRTVPRGGAPNRETPDYRDWITGSWRQQAWGPRLSQRRLRYFGAYLRGPEDAPIRPHTTVRVLAVPPKPDQDA